MRGRAVLSGQLMKEGLLPDSYTPNLVSEERLQWAVDLLLGMQNPSGGYGSYERCRGSIWLEALNPAEVFGPSIFSFWFVVFHGVSSSDLD